MKTSAKAIMAVMALEQLEGWVEPQQLELLKDLCCGGEEAGHFRALVCAMAARIAGMPKTYAQEGKGDQAMAYLHYFRGGSDFWILERDSEPEQLQAFGLAQINGQDPELGYINIPELVANNFELELYDQPRTLAEIKAKRLRAA